MANKAQMIDLLIADPKTEREVGFNSALITLLKADYKTTSVPRGSINQHKSLRTILGDTYFSILPSHVVDELIACKASKQKLNAVKILKEHTRLGLKEAKDFMDSWF